eukprot:tig00021012_g17011.t1
MHDQRLSSSSVVAVEWSPSAKLDVTSLRDELKSRFNPANEELDSESRRIKLWFTDADAAAGARRQIQRIKLNGREIELLVRLELAGTEGGSTDAHDHDQSLGKSARPPRYGPLEAVRLIRMQSRPGEFSAAFVRFRRRQDAARLVRGSRGQIEVESSWGSCTGVAEFSKERGTFTEEDSAGLEEVERDPSPRPTPGPDRDVGCSRTARPDPEADSDVDIGGPAPDPGSGSPLGTPLARAASPQHEQSSSGSGEPLKSAPAAAPLDVDMSSSCPDPDPEAGAGQLDPNRAEPLNVAAALASAAPAPLTSSAAADGDGLMPPPQTMHMMGARGCSGRLSFGGDSSGRGLVLGSGCPASPPRLVRVQREAHRERDGYAAVLGKARALLGRPDRDLGADSASSSSISRSAGGYSRFVETLRMAAEAAEAEREEARALMAQLAEELEEARAAAARVSAPLKLLAPVSLLQLRVTLSTPPQLEAAEVGRREEAGAAMARLTAELKEARAAAARLEAAEAGRREEAAAAITRLAAELKEARAAAARLEAAEAGRREEAAAAMTRLAAELKEARAAAARKYENVKRGYFEVLAEKERLEARLRQLGHAP